MEGESHGILLLLCFCSQPHRIKTKIKVNKDDEQTTGLPQRKKPCPPPPHMEEHPPPPTSSYYPNEEVNDSTIAARAGGRGIGVLSTPTGGISSPSLNIPHHHHQPPSVPPHHHHYGKGGGASGAGVNSSKKPPLTSPPAIVDASLHHPSTEFTPSVPQPISPASHNDSSSSSSSSEEEAPRRMTLSERFGKLAQLSSQRQEYDGVRMKIVREGGQSKKVYLEAGLTR